MERKKPERNGTEVNFQIFGERRLIRTRLIGFDHGDFLYRTKLQANKKEGRKHVI